MIDWFLTINSECVVYWYMAADLLDQISAHSNPFALSHTSESNAQVESVYVLKGHRRQYTEKISYDLKSVLVWSLKVCK